MSVVTNKFNLPETFERFQKKNSHSSGGADITVTSLKSSGFAESIALRGWKMYLIMSCPSLEQQYTRSWKRVLQRTTS